MSGFSSTGDFLGRAGRQFRALYNKQGIGARILTIALVPSLITALLLTALLVQQKMNEVEHNTRSGLLSAARNLASASQYGLISGNLMLLQQQVDTTRALEQLQFAVVQASDGSLSAQAGTRNGQLPSPLPSAGVVATHPGRWLSVAPVTLPDIAPGAGDLAEPDLLSAPAAAPLAPKVIGYAIVAIDTRAMQTSRRNALLLAAMLALASATLTALIAWRMSKRLTRRIRHLSHTVERIAGGQLEARVDAQATADLGLLEEGVNRMAQSLQINRDELEARIQEATADLLEKKDEAERANIAKSRFFAAASHDLRQPLHALSLFSEVLTQKTASSPELSRLGEQIGSSVYSMQTLLNALLDVSRLDANIIEVHPEHFPATPMLERIHQQYARTASEKGLTFNIRGCACTLHTDPVLLERILLNLVSNAIRCTRQGGILLTCRKRGETMLIQVWDTGIGIPYEAHTRIFQEFVQLDNPERDRNKGLGLGLAIVSRMAGLLGASVQMRSRIGRGSVFGVLIPQGDSRFIDQTERPPMTSTALEGMLGVLVDDDDSVLNAMQELFNAWDIDLLAARSAEEAIELLRELERQPDFLITDYRLPENTDGIVVARRFRQQFGAAFPVLILTGDTAPETLQRIALAGFDILHKPVRPARLRAMLSHLLKLASD